MHFQYSWSDWVDLWRLCCPMMKICSKRTMFASQAKFFTSTPFPMPLWVVAGITEGKLGTEGTNFTKLQRSGNWFGGRTINSRQTGEHVLSLLPLGLGCKLTGAGQISLFHVSESCETTSQWSQVLPKCWGTVSYTHCPSFILCIFTLPSDATSGSSGESSPSPEQVLSETFVHPQGIYSCCTLQEIKTEHTNDSASLLCRQWFASYFLQSRMSPTKAWFSCLLST